jgi:hypothetical protein
MHTTTSTLEYPRRHAVSAEEYLRMGEAGVFGPEATGVDRRGDCRDDADWKPACGSRQHTQPSVCAARWRPRYCGGAKSGHRLDRTVPQPDLALLAPRPDYYSSAHPSAHDVFLVVEVADTTLAFDIERKVPLYARAGIREGWVVDVNEQAVRVYRDPSASGYKTSFTATGKDAVTSVGLSDVSLIVSDMFPR